jgi:hypothetical protein
MVLKMKTDLDHMREGVGTVIRDVVSPVFQECTCTNRRMELTVTLTNNTLEVVQLLLNFLFHPCF